jgi:integrase
MHDGSFMVSARQKKWGLDVRKNFPSLKTAVAFREQLVRQLEQHGAQTHVPKEKLVIVDAYEKLIEKLNPYGKTPEDAVDHYLVFLATEMLRETKPLLRKLVDLWETEKLTSKIRPLSERTRSELKQYSRYLCRMWGDQKSHDITRQTVEDALNKLPVQNRNTRRKYLRYIRMFFIWLKDHKHNSGNPTDGIKIKSEPFEARFYKPEVIEKLLCHILKPEHKDLIGFYTLLIFAGLRPSEGKRVIWNDIDFETGELYVRKGKKESRRFILHPTAISWLKFHKENSEKDSPFIQVKNLANREKKVRSIVEGEWEQDGLRHGMATYYNALVQDPYKVAHVLGDIIQTIKRHYMRSVAVSEMKSFWALTPENILPKTN